MVLNDKFAEYIMDQLSGIKGASMKRMFGGAGIFHDGKMFALIHEARFFLKVDDRNIERFKERGMEQFKPFKDKPMRMPYYEVPSEVLENKEELNDWAGSSLRAAHGN